MGVFVSIGCHLDSREIATGNEHDRQRPWLVTSGFARERWRCGRGKVGLFFPCPTRGGPRETEGAERLWGTRGSSARVAECSGLIPSRGWVRREDRKGRRKGGKGRGEEWEEGGRTECGKEREGEGRKGEEGGNREDGKGRRKV